MFYGRVRRLSLLVFEQAVNAFDDDTDILRAPHPAHNPRVLFAGEYISKAYFQCVDGAFDTGGRWYCTICSLGG